MLNKINFRGKEYHLICHDDHIGKGIEKHEKFYEQPMLEFIKDLNLPGTYIDVGANIGNHSIFFAGECNCNKVIAIEPVIENVELIMNNSIKNSLNRLIIIPVAVGNKPGFVGVQTNPANMGMCKVIPGADIPILIPILPLDLLNLKDVTLLKIDVEGMEYQVLQGAEQILKKHHPVIFVEKSNEYEDFLIGLGYKFIRDFNYTPTSFYKWIP